jgi:hypothetical protein
VIRPLQLRGPALLAAGVERVPFCRRACTSGTDITANSCAAAEAFGLLVVIRYTVVPRRGCTEDMMPSATHCMAI